MAVTSERTELNDAVESASSIYYDDSLDFWLLKECDCLQDVSFPLPMDVVKDLGNFHSHRTSKKDKISYFL